MMKKMSGAALGAILALIGSAVLGILIGGWLAFFSYAPTIAILILVVVAIGSYLGSKYIPPPD